MIHANKTCIDASEYRFEFGDCPAGTPDQTVSESMGGVSVVGYESLVPPIDQPRMPIAQRSNDGNQFPQDQVCIDFETGAPCVFQATIALREAFSGLGVHFDGPASRDGGGILDQCGNFGVNARSGVDFLAFNRGATFGDGGVPRDPKTVKFDFSASSASIWVSGGFSNAKWNMDAFDSSGNLITSSSIATVAGSYGELALNGSGIRSVVITKTSGASAFVMDDLCVDLGSCLTMDVSTLVSGQNATWGISGATPGARVAVIYGFAAGNTVVNGQFGYCATFGIKGVNSSKVVGSKLADGSGNASIIKKIPGGTSGVKVLTQAAQQGTCPNECLSDVDTQAIQ